MKHQKTFDIVKHTVLLSIAINSIFRAYSKINIDPVFNTSDLFHALIFIIILIYYNFKYHQALFITINKRRERKARAKEEKEIITNFLEDKLEHETSQELNTLIMNIRNRYFLPTIQKEYAAKLKEKMTKAKQILEELTYQEKIQDLKKEKQEAEEQLKNIEELHQLQMQSEEELLEKIKNDMKIWENPVFFKEDLSEQQIPILKNEGYKQTNQYSISSKRNETVLVKTIMNHSTTHTFLVWEIKELLDILGAEKIKEHQTVDADLTFKYKNRFYAIEVETGSLLKKKRQAIDKVSYLKKKYNTRWLFVVSNKNLLKEYKKLGFAAQRSMVEKTIKKWLKITP